MGVQAIILVEDSVRYYSSFLPVDLRRADAALAAALVPEGHQPVAQADAACRRGRRSCSARTFEEAWQHFTQLPGRHPRRHLRHRVPARRRARRRRPASSSRAACASRSPTCRSCCSRARPRTRRWRRAVGASFLLKGSPTLLARAAAVHGRALRLRRLRVPPARRRRGRPRARSARRSRRSSRTVPADEHRLPRRAQPFLELAQGAHRVRARRTSCGRARCRDFASSRTCGASLIDAIASYRREPQPRHRRRLRPRRPSTPRGDFCRIGGGSLGGKARGLAFVRFLLGEYAARATRFAGVRHRRAAGGRARHRRVRPRSSTTNDLRDFALERRRRRARSSAASCAARVSRGRARATCARSSTRRATRSRCARRACSRTRSTSRSPASTRRSCSPTTTPTRDGGSRSSLRGDQARLRLDVLAARQGLPARDAVPPRRREDGGDHPARRGRARTATRFYPDFAGRRALAQLLPAAAARGRGRHRGGGARPRARRSSSGERLLALLPALPAATSSSSRRSSDVLRELAARRSGRSTLEPRRRARAPMREARFGLEVAEADGTLAAVGSTYSPENDAIYDGISRPGVRLVSFAPILKHEPVPAGRDPRRRCSRSASRAWAGRSRSSSR